MQIPHWPSIWCQWPTVPHSENNDRAQGYAKDGDPHFYRFQFPVRLCFSMTVNKVNLHKLDCVLEVKFNLVAGPNPLACRTGPRK
jgi:hypothetical protein